MVAPLAVIVVVLPVQIVFELALVFTVGVVVTFIEIVLVFVQPELIPVTV